MTLPKVELAIVADAAQPPQWWSTVFARLISEHGNTVDIARTHSVTTALPDNGKNAHIFAPIAPLEQVRRNSRTDVNRNVAVGVAVNKDHDNGFFMGGKADWVFWLDTDVVPPPGVITRLLSLRRDFVGGVYFLGDNLHDPLIYMREPEGTYKALRYYEKGTLIPVDAIGMGCTLIHRSVYEKVLEEHVVFSRPNGSLFPVHKSMIRDKVSVAEGEPYVENGVYHLPLREPVQNDTRPWPFYAMEYGRTEDMHFCELTANVGIRPYVDTSIECAHLKLQPIERHHQLEALERLENED